ncbi:MAG: 16S rRNA (guanine(527)-N(7))-methyltransferase RsmG [Halothiobacillus sp. 24-54-40]|nr:MAG: 16S rRNA (guanine(527)-N(7))-methyltransferase RsmG [Halothiobacillus sp. 35-54-62]OYZ86463.1 MAG: 16S rRNA (guanine(527)-N(7))-methyltransferase RsmG [Halothiobacillus sp. 24-54-40]OZA80262.1 MAG: 16S rRNA (guanine(527)-N(7))-methyltransferase RsmG [Halothiobacillus sp. 39-53-45]HQS03348.1 16S rRNA (guanine(527)-N(7))-methyltransferase RsmG [Halothiobacillus sp.]HQS29926.1 16S rRNA (guanine(527)-N(7))-methyltransferase RsmG [Halothiobacillus sp.]
MAMPTPAPRAVLAEQIAADMAQMQQPVQPEAAERIAAYLQLLAKWNRAYNLTAVRAIQDMRVRHVLDSVAVRPWIKSGQRLVDVGSGPGLPGIILALADDALDVTLIDANLKMTRFAEAAVRELAIKNVTIVRGRVETVIGAQYDQIISRAFASTADFLTLTEHLASPNSMWLAMKGRPDESVQSPFICRATHALIIPGLDAQRHLQIYQKEGAS